MLNHWAYVTHDVAATADFYARILAMELASTIFDDQVPSTGEDFPYFHIFFRMEGKGCCALVADGKPRVAAPAAAINKSRRFISFPVEPGHQSRMLGLRRFWSQSIRLTWRTSIS